MSTDNSSDNGGSVFIASEASMPRVVRFWLMLLFNIPSIICTFCLIIHITTNRNQRNALQNHTILVILIFGLPIQLMDINFYLAFFHYGSVQPPRPILCLFWWLADYGFYTGGMMLMTWLAIERHILIFHDQCVASRRGRFLFHYIPLSTLTTYILLYYISVIFILPCENTYDYLVPVCGASPCYQSYGFLGIWEFSVHDTASILLEGIATTGLVLRVHLQKRRLHRSAQWQKQRRMIIQLFLISGLNISLNLPIFFIPLLHLCGLPPQYGVQPELYFFFFGYFVIFLFPFASLCQYPELRKKITGMTYGLISKQPHRTATVAPTAREIPMNILP